MLETENKEILEKLMKIWYFSLFSEFLHRKLAEQLMTRPSKMYCGTGFEV